VIGPLCTVVPFAPEAELFAMGFGVLGSHATNARKRHAAFVLLDEGKHLSLATARDCTYVEVLRASSSDALRMTKYLHISANQTEIPENSYTGKIRR
jgi:hypothetical protein